MELFTLIFANLDVVFGVFGGVVTLASLITAGTKTPNPETGLGKVYKIVEAMALVVGKAKQNGKEDKQ